MDTLDLLDLPDKNTLLINRGLIMPPDKEHLYKEYMDQHTKLNIGEFHDVLAVVYKEKPIAALDYSKKNMEYYEDKNKLLINEIINKCNNDNFMLLQVHTDDPSYLKSLMFRKGEYKDALRFIQVLWFNEYPEHSFHYMLGKLLRYDIENIKAFYLRNLDIILSDDMIKEYDKLLSETNPKLDDLQHPSCRVTLHDHIPLL